MKTIQLLLSVILCCNFLTMSVFGSTFRGSNLKNPSPVVFDSTKRTAGSNENMQISLNEPLSRVRKFTVADASIPVSYYAVNDGNNILTLNTLSALIGGFNRLNYYIAQNSYTREEIVDEVKGRLSEQGALVYFSYDNDTGKFFFESDVTFTMLPYLDISVAGFVGIPANDFDYEYISSGVKTLGFDGETTQGTSSSGIEILSASVPVNWDLLVFEDKNSRVPIGQGTGNGVTVADGIYMVHDLAAAIETALNAISVTREYTFKYNMIKNVFSIRADRIINVIASATNENSFLGFTQTSSNIVYALSVDGDTTPPLIQPVVNGINMNFRINEILGMHDVQIFLPDLVNDTLETATDNLQVALDAAGLTFTYTVEVEPQNNNFVLSSTGQFSILSSSATFSNAYGLLAVSVSNKEWGNVYYYPSINMVTTVADTFRVGILNTQPNMPIGTYTHEEFRSELETQLNNVLTFDTWTVLYSNPKNRITIENLSATNNYAIIRTVNSIYLQLGMNLIVTSVPTNGIYEFSNISVMDPDKYIYIKSFALSQRKENNFNSNVAFENVVGRLLIRVSYKGTENTYFNGLNQIIFPLNVTYDVIDFRLEFENGRLVELNGQDWSLLLVFATF